ncbi:Spo0E family sporulation regulatory protein-aspartic acid phosphatase [Neobacillus rhizosphaerae]|nr:Spo0E family sporulation regulatory protein-aspartic acid phosphatase [Neobacillus rhizosphaerae]
MMKAKEYVEKENIKLLMEIFNLKSNLHELYIQKGSASSEYISLSIKLDLLIKEYFEEKIVKLVNMPTSELIEIWKQNEFNYLDTIRTVQKLDEIIFQ